MKWWLGMATLVVLVTLAAFWWVFGDPVSSSVTDPASLLTMEERSRIANYHRQLLNNFDIDYRLVTTNAAEDIDRFAEAAFDRHGVGKLSAQSRGLLLIVDPALDQVRLEVGYALEPVFTDAFVSYIERQQMVPFFRSGRVADGILATTELIVERADKASEGAAWVRTPMPGSGGGGAKTQAHIGAGRQKKSSKTEVDLFPGNTPDATLEAYVAAMARHDDSADLAIYTAETQDMLRGWTITPAQMNNVVQSIRNCPKDAIRINEAAGFAVVRYSVKSRKCSPFFLRHIGGAWRLDLMAQQKHIRFSNRNYWHFVSGPPTEFAFAFDDWEFDRRGFPH